MPSHALVAVCHLPAGSSQDLFPCAAHVTKLFHWVMELGVCQGVALLLVPFSKLFAGFSLEMLLSSSPWLILLEDRAGIF